MKGNMFFLDSTPLWTSGTAEFICSGGTGDVGDEVTCELSDDSKAFCLFFSSDEKSPFPVYVMSLVWVGEVAISMSMEPLEEKRNREQS